MNYEKFPFGKYKGYLLSELPNTYIVYALETFDLPEELNWKLQECLLENLAIDYPLSIQLKKVEEIHKGMCADYHRDNGWGAEVMDAINDYRDRIMEASL
jgi:hypothetical protein